MGCCTSTDEDEQKPLLHGGDVLPGSSSRSVPTGSNVMPPDPVMPNSVPNVLDEELLANKMQEIVSRTQGAYISTGGELNVSGMTAAELAAGAAKYRSLLAGLEPHAPMPVPLCNMKESSRGGPQAVQRPPVLHSDARLQAITADIHAVADARAKMAIEFIEDLVVPLAPLED